jgi:hypothetical protein
MLVWKNAYRQPACRFGIAGDFLPACGLSPVDRETWSGQAKRVAPRFDDLEFSLVNLECPVGVEGLPPKVKASLGDSFAAQIECLDYLDSLKASVVGIANNHLYDYGRAGAERTLGRAGERLSVCGFGRTLEEPPSVCIREARGGVRVGIWAAARNLPDAATRNSMGIEPATRERAAKALAHMAARNVQCRVAFLHAGAEGTSYPDPMTPSSWKNSQRRGLPWLPLATPIASAATKQFRGRNGDPAHCFYGSAAYRQASFIRRSSMRAW